jgi:xanthine dehydrogenase accessory factor
VTFPSHPISSSNQGIRDFLKVLDVWRLFMNHVRSLIDAWRVYQRQDRPIFLATVVKTQGSTYRRPGARMLVASAEDQVGMVSGGCLENDIVHHIKQSKDSTQPFVITYDINAHEDLTWGFGLGCEGVVHVLVESLLQSQRVHPMEFIEGCFERHQSGVLATVFCQEGLADVKIGDRLALSADGTLISDITNLRLHQEIAIAAQTAWKSQQSQSLACPLPGGTVKALIEVIQPQTSLVIFGAGRDAIPLVQFAKALGWYVTIVDCRSLDSTRDRFAHADRVILTRRDCLLNAVQIDPKSASVIMTHNYFDDLAALNRLSNSSARYIGMLGSQQRIQRLIDDATTPAKDRLHAPIGLDIGAETPEEIAIAIIAEIQTVLAQRSGCSLRDRQNPIHEIAETSIAKRL